MGYRSEYRGGAVCRERGELGRSRALSNPYLAVQRVNPLDTPLTAAEVGDKRRAELTVLILHTKHEGEGCSIRVGCSTSPFRVVCRSTCV